MTIHDMSGKLVFKQGWMRFPVFRAEYRKCEEHPCQLQIQEYWKEHKMKSDIGNYFHMPLLVYYDNSWTPL